jgi:histidyl-tRNA synthetase
MATKRKKSDLTQPVKGMHDILPEEHAKRDLFLEKAKNIASYYGFKPIHTPHLEKLDLFTLGLGEATDVVEKQMYGIKIRGGEKLVLRPEGTAPIVRAYLQHGMHTRPQPVMLYYQGFFFRHEKPQKGRRRELHQFGLEILGEQDAITDAIIVKTCLLILEEMGLKPLQVHVNSIGDKECRKIYQKELTAYYRKNADNVCKDCKRRLKTNPLRLLDCKEEKCIEIKSEAPQIINYLCDECTTHFKDFLEILDASEIPYYLDHYLVRGLDYYSRTVFEVFVEKEKKDSKKDDQEEPKEKETEKLALAGGGRYDALSNILSNKNIPAVGCAIGIDRIISLVGEKSSLSPKEKPFKVFFIQLGSAAKYKSLNILESLRKSRISTSHSLSKDSLKSQLKIASKLRVKYALIFGQKEAMDETIIVRNMETASQETVPLDKLIDYLKKRLK